MAAKRNDTEVFINNKKYTLSGFESEEYLQKVAGYINSKISELKTLESYRNLDNEMKTVLLEINLADDYFKVKRRFDDSENDSDSKSSEIYQLKHEIMSLNSRLEKTNKEIEKLRENIVEEQKKNVRLETELNAERERRMTERSGKK
ncbi:MAG: cell division protein ZapA [Lachnospiraceae bacterium]|nr:cell division protein ZapA [Lachnospiraceae bacterium]MCR5769542.1 cell division protein ZapA [Lachnospiraceae bacterium]